MENKNVVIEEVKDLSPLEKKVCLSEYSHKKTGMGRTLDTYFKPKSFERSGRLYEKIGIRPFKKAVTYSGKLFLYPFNKLIGRNGFEKPDWPNNYWIWEHTVKGLKKFEKATRITEAYHLLFEVLLTASVASNNPNLLKSQKEFLRI